MTHTQGPWSEPLPEGFGAVIHANGKTVARVYGHPRWDAEQQRQVPRGLFGQGDRERDEEGEANAYLIWAAPDLLAAAEEALKAATYPRSWEKEPHPLAVMLEAAIKKAKGAQ